VRAQQRLGLVIADLDEALVDTNQDAAADGSGTRGVAAVVHPHGGVVPHRSDDFSEAAKRLGRQRMKMGFLFLEHRLDLALGAAVDTQRRPLLFPV